jgi:AraC-like DNA-binding protein
LAQSLGHSTRWLEFLFRRRFHLTPKAWLVHLRNKEILRLARSRQPAKMVSQIIGFADSASFCHSLRRNCGHSFRELQRIDRNRASQKDNN